MKINSMKFDVIIQAGQSNAEGVDYLLNTARKINILKTGWMAMDLERRKINVLRFAIMRKFLPS